MGPAAAHSCQRRACLLVQLCNVCIAPSVSADTYPCEHVTGSWQRSAVHRQAIVAGTDGSCTEVPIEQWCDTTRPASWNRRGRGTCCWYSVGGADHWSVGTMYVVLQPSAV
jgi:hypothetical protein